MTIDSLTGKSSAHPRRPWLEALLLVGFLLFLLLGVAAFTAFFMLSRPTPSPTGMDPLQALQPAQILPALTVQQLAGDPPAALAFQALNAGELATSHAIALFDTQASGASRAGLTSQLARRYLANQADGEAALTLNTVRALAVLDAEIPPLERTQLLTQVAEGFMALGRPDAALDAAEQALLVGAGTPDLLPAQRQQIFAALEPVAEAMDSEPFSTRLSDLVRNPYLTPGGVLLAPQMNALAEPLAYDQPLMDAIATRQLAALQLAERIRLTNGADIGPEQAALTSALLREDQARQVEYARLAAQPPTQPQQLWLLLDQRAWLALKTRIGLGGFGLSLAPEWESTVEGLKRELAQNAVMVDTAVKALAATQSDPIQRAMLELEGLQWLALQAELGLYADAPLVELSEQLRIAQLQFAQTGAPVALPVAYGADAVPPGFRIQP